MRILLAATCLSIVVPGTAEAGGGAPARGDGDVRPARAVAPATAGVPAGQPRWGGRVGGRWWAGGQAPGGWSAYRRPVRGTALPPYWVSPRWSIADWSGYGLPRPPYGYTWTRYYDDAVLIDRRGSVHDTIGGVDWDQFDPDGVDYAYRGEAPVYDGHAYPDRPGAPYPYPPRRDDGAGGAALGAIVGGVAGAAIAGPGEALGGALIGGGVGALTGYAIDRNEDRRPVPPPASAVRYPPAVATRAAPPPPPPYRAPGAIVTAAPGTTVVTSSTAAATPGYYSNGYYYPGTSVTTVTVQPQATVTTTTTTTTSEVWQ